MQSGDYILETLKSSLLFNFHTGNAVFDTFVTGLIICLSTYLMSFVTKLQDFDFKEWFGFLLGNTDPYNEITISGKKMEGARSTKCSYSTTFHALLYQIKKLDCATSNISKLSEIQLDEDYENDWSDYDDDENVKDEEKEKQKDANLIVSQCSPFKIAENIEALVKINKEKETDDEGGMKTCVKTEEFEIKIRSSVLSMDALREQIRTWLKEYQDLMAPDKYLRYFLYSPPNERDDYYNPSRSYSEFRFESGKSFNNVFFPKKEDLMKRLDFFKENKAWYKDRGIPYTIGLLLYGVPGCGKTSTIKAIANYTQRHIVSVPLNRIKTCKELLSIFYEEQINHMNIPLSKRLYVLEDIDCSELKDIVRERSSEDSDSNKDSDQDSGNGAVIGDEETKNFLNLFKGPKDKVANWMKEKKQLTLAGILEVLDGVMEMDGRMLVITTNYPERLDAALIRPGRIDVKLNFGRCTSHCLVQMYEHFFNDRESSSLWPKTFERSQLPDDRWTPAEATQILLNNIHDPHQGLQHLLYEYPQTKKSLEENST
jgi:DNA replication protein DnaC